MKKKLIITADDYGMCESVNQAIEECLAAGTVHATCAMANMPAFFSSGHLRTKFSKSSLGIHWTLTEGRPVASPRQVPSLLQSDGTFHSPAQLRRLWIQRRIAADDVKTELQAQYRRFCDAAGQPDFWNTHQNFHVWPGLYGLCVALGQQLQIPKMRSHRRFLARNRTMVFYHITHPVSWLKGEVISWWASCARRQGMVMPDGLIYMPGYGADPTSIEDVGTCIDWASVVEALEMIVHPSTTGNEPLFHRNGERRVMEFRLLTNPRLPEVLHRAGVVPVGFEALQRSRIAFN